MFSQSLSIIIPAFNEEKNIRAACEDINRIAEKYFSKYEILVFDDASVDRTAEVVRQLQKENPHIYLFQNLINKGLGYNYRSGISNATCHYAVLVPGDNEVSADSLEEVFKQIGTTDIVITYATNPEVRPLWRQRISSLFTSSLNFLFQLKVRYYNGPSVIRTDLAKRFVPVTSGFAYMAVMLVQLLKSGASYKEVGFSLQGRQYGRTKAFRFKNVISVIKNIFVLYWKIMILHQLKHIPQSAAQPSFRHSRIGS